MPLILYGAGGHGKVVLDAALCLGIPVAFVVDDNPVSDQLLGVPVLSSSRREWLELDQFQFLVSIGDISVRTRIFNALCKRGGNPVNIIHPSAQVARSAQLGLGVAVCAGVVVNPGSVIGDNCILNTSASIDHDCVTGSHAHLCPGVLLAGSVAVGECSLVGTGAVVLPGVKIGRGCVIGAGAVVNRDIPDGAVAYGVPAKVHRTMDTFLASGQ